MEKYENGVGFVGGKSCKCKELGLECSNWDIGTDEDGLLEAEEDFLADGPEFGFQTRSYGVKYEARVPELEPLEQTYQRFLFVESSTEDTYNFPVTVMLNGEMISVDAEQLIQAVGRCVGRKVRIEGLDF